MNQNEKYQLHRSDAGESLGSAHGLCEETRRGRKILIIFLVVICYSNLNAQIITTFGGNGSLTSTGDGGPATSAGIANPAFGTFDGKGNYYYEDGHASTGPKVRKIDTFGIISPLFRVCTRNCK